jgi:uncharacterized lipoprotein YmbA
MRRALALAAVLALLGGCGERPVMRSYVLGDPSWRPDRARPQTGLAAVELRRVSIPDYLDTTDMVRRVGDNEILPSPTGRWGERLSLGLTDSLASALARHRPDLAVTTMSSPGQGRHVFVRMDAIDLDSGGQCRVVASWRVTGWVGLRTGRATFAETATALDDAAMAAVLTRVVDQLAGQIATTLDGE